MPRINCTRGVLFKKNHILGGPPDLNYTNIGEGKSFADSGRPLSPSAQATDAAEHVSVLTVVRTGRRAPTLLARARGHLCQEAGSGELPPAP
jgi:hypothetical protein